MLNSWLVIIGSYLQMTGLDPIAKKCRYVCPSTGANYQIHQLFPYIYISYLLIYLASFTFITYIFPASIALH